MTISDQKKALRKQLLQIRDDLDVHTWREKSSCIHKAFFEKFDIDKYECIHLYISMDERKEVETISLIKALLQKKKRIAVPITQFEPPSLNHSFLYDINDLAPNKWGVMEPVSTYEVNKSEFNLVVVPLVGADNNKNRIGYGKGFYDRFLGQLSAVKVGFCFEECLLNKVPVEDFDIPLDYIITDQKVIE